MTIRRILASIPMVVFLVVSCGTAAEPLDPTSTIGPMTTPPPPTTTAAPTTTVVSTTTSSSSVVDEAEGSGCTPGPGELGEGEWFGYVVTASDSNLDFDLACWFSGDAAIRASAEDGEESPPPNDYYIRNDNETIRSLDVSATAEVVWYPEPGDPSAEATIAYPDWVAAIEDREFGSMVWLTVEEGDVVAIREQWVP